MATAALVGLSIALFVMLGALGGAAFVSGWRASL